MVGSVLLLLFVSIYVLGWTLLLFLPSTISTAYLLRPYTFALLDRIIYGLGMITSIQKKIIIMMMNRNRNNKKNNSNNNNNNKRKKKNDDDDDNYESIVDIDDDNNTTPNEWLLQCQTLVRIFVRILILLPLFAILWFIDEILWGNTYNGIQIKKPVIIVAAPRSGSTSFQNTLALDNQYYSPTIIEWLLPFICIHKVIHWFGVTFPIWSTIIYERIEYEISKNNTRHPITLYTAETDDMLLAEWHYITFAQCRTFPVAQYFYKHHNPRTSIVTTTTNHTDNHHHHLQSDLSRTPMFLDIVLKKILLMHCDPITGGGQQQQPKRLLLRTHRSPWIQTDFVSLYPDATYIGILRHPISMLRSGAGLILLGLNETKNGIVNTLHDINNTKTKNGIVNTLHDINNTKNTTAEEQEDRTLNKETWSGGLVAMYNEMYGHEVELFGDNNNSNINNNDKSTQSTTSSSSHCLDTHCVTFSLFKKDPIYCIQQLYKECNIEMSHQFYMSLVQSHNQHTNYKQQHKYNNPTLQELAIHENTFLQLPNVQKYIQLLKQKTVQEEEQEQQQQKQQEDTQVVVLIKNPINKEEEDKEEEKKEDSTTTTHTKIIMTQDEQQQKDKKHDDSSKRKEILRNIIY